MGAPLDNGTNAFIRVPVTFIDKSIDERKNQLWSSISSLGYWLSALAISPAPTASNAFEDRLMLPAPYLSGRLDSLHVAKDFGFRDGEHDLRIGLRVPMPSASPREIDSSMNFDESREPNVRHERWTKGAKRPLGRLARWRGWASRPLERTVRRRGVFQRPRWPPVAVARLFPVDPSRILLHVRINKGIKAHRREIGLDGPV